MEEKVPLAPCFVMNNGQSIPAIGLGTWRTPKEVATQAIKDAIEVGYRLIDCAYSYGNEKEVGDALETKFKCGELKREDIFVTSKLWNTFHSPDHVRQACEDALRKLKLSYLDCYLMHWPTAFKYSTENFPLDDQGNTALENIDYIDTWIAMENLVDTGLTRCIGISNFNKQQIERLLGKARIKPTLLQIECHPYLTQFDLADFCQQHSIIIISYSSLGSGHTPYQKPGSHPLLEHPKILSIAASHDRTPSQILLRYQVQRNNVVIPRSVNRKHMQLNLNLFNFILTNEEMEEISSLNFNGRFLTFEQAKHHLHYPFANEDVDKTPSEPFKGN